jgi:hypothetical protein
LTKDVHNYYIKGNKAIAVVTIAKQNDGDNLKNIRCEASRHFRNKRRKYMKDIINELAISSKSKNIRGLYG